MLQIGEILKKVPFLKTLPKEGIDFIIERLKFKTFDAGQLLFKAGDPGDCMFIVLTGEVKVFITHDGEDEELAKIGAGNYFGEMALLTGDPRSASIKSTQPAEMFTLYKKEFDEVLGKYPMISIEMGKIMSQRLRDTISKRAAADARASKTTSVAPTGPSGSLKDRSLIDVIRFCESNTLTGTLKITNAGKTGVIEYDKGAPMSIRLEGKKDDDALDEMLGWEDGQFVITPKALSFEDSKAEPAAKPEEKKIVLVVNSSLAVRKLVEKAFAAMGYQAYGAESEAKAMEVLNSIIPNVIISDVKLSDSNANDFSKKVRENSKLANIYFIFIRDENLNQVQINEIQAISNSQLTKGHEVSEFVGIVEKVMHR